MDVPHRFVRGDREAFEALFDEWHGDVYRWIVRIVRDRSAAEDLTIETFWRIYRSRATFDPSRSFGAWSRRIATNVSREHLARRRVEVQLPEPLPDRRGADPAVTADVRRRVRSAVARLPPKFRIVVMLALVEELTQPEIADALDIPVGTVKSRLFHALRLLRRKLRTSGVTP